LERKREGIAMTTPAEDFEGLNNRLHELDRRVLELKQENSLLKSIGICILAVGVVTFLVFLGVWVAPRKQIEAKSLIIRDRSGTPRAWLGLDKNEVPTLALYDTKGKGQFDLRVNEDAVAMRFFANEKLSLVLGARKEDAAIIFVDEWGEPRIMMLTNFPQHFASVSLLGDNKEPKATRAFKDNTVFG
jgi:hypothetical protein